MEVQTRSEATLPGNSDRERVVGMHLAVGLLVVLTLLPWPAECLGRAGGVRQNLDTIEAAIDYQRSLTELLGQLEAYLEVSSSALEKAKALRTAGVVTEADVASHAASVDASTKKIAALKAKLAEVDAAIARLGAAAPVKAANPVSAIGIQSLEVPFDASVDRLPARYQGHQPGTLSEVLKAADVSKDEFETTAQHVGRVRSKVPTARLALQMDTDAAGLRVHYNADRQVIIAEVQAEKWTRVRHGELEDLYLLQATSSGYSERNLTLVCRDLPGFKSTASYARPLSWVGEVHAEPDQARSLVPRLRVLLVGLIPHDVPIEELFPRRSALRRDVSFVLEQIWVYDGVTGDVVAKGVFAKRPPPLRD